MYQDQVSNMFITEQIRSALTLDPFQHLRENIPHKRLERLINNIGVVSYHSVKTMEGYVRTEAIVALAHNNDISSTTGSNISSLADVCTTSPNSRYPNHNDKFNKKRRRTDQLQTAAGCNLHFTYVRTSMTSTHPCTVSYTIDLCHTATPTTIYDCRPKPLLWIHVYAAGAVPSSHDTSRAININENDDDDDQWSDIEEDEQSKWHDDAKVIKDSSIESRPTSSGSTRTSKVSRVIDTAEPDIDTNNDDCECGSKNSNNSQSEDRYEAGMDPDVVAILISYLASISTAPSETGDNVAQYSEITIFFLLMTFPFYEHEWDLVGFLLQAVFDTNSIDTSEEE
jgi:hypothetical protein